eukprot:Rmarinus@m.28156
MPPRIRRASKDLLAAVFRSQPQSSIDSVSEEPDTEIELVNQRIAQFLQQLFSDQTPNPQDIMSILEEMKHEGGRSAFAQTLINRVTEPSTGCLQQPQYLLLNDIVKALLREAFRAKDFRSAHYIFEASSKYFRVNANGKTTLQESIQDHELFKSYQYWETMVLDTVSDRRKQICGPDEEYASLLSAMSDEEKEEMESNLRGIALETLRENIVVMGSMMPVATVITFVPKLAFALQLPNEEIESTMSELTTRLSSGEDNDAPRRPATIAPILSSAASHKEEEEKSFYRQSLRWMDKKKDVVRDLAKTNKAKMWGEFKSTLADFSSKGGTKSTPLSAERLPSGGVSSRAQPEGGAVEEDPRIRTARTTCTMLRSERAAKFLIDAGTSVLPGEEAVLCLENTVFIPSSHMGLRDSKEMLGHLVLTNYRLHFVNTMQDYQMSANPFFKDVANAPVGLITRIKKVEGTSQNAAMGSMEVVTKDGRELQFRGGSFVIDASAKHSTVAIFDFLDVLSLHAFCTDVETLFAYSSKEMFDAEGWHLYRPDREFVRQGVLRRLDSPAATPEEDGTPWRVDGTGGWKYSSWNDGFGQSPTYPLSLMIPGNASDSDIIGCAKFRSKKRLPALTWRHPRNFASLTRCSQPLVGLSRHRSGEDERYLQAVALCDRRDAQEPARLHIVDARPKANAVANQAIGGGFENTENYTIPNVEVKLTFAGIDNIHVMRTSLQQLREALDKDKDAGGSNFNGRVDSSAWLKHVRLLLQNSDLIASELERGTSVVVHCSDGWDRTSQLVALALLQLDPYYRTLPGFCVLLEKDWISFGHKFGQRCGHLGEKEDDQRSPIFVQFLDAVWQMTRQFPSAFEFNDELLQFIAENIYTCRFGTFLFNCEQEREHSNALALTRSMWSYVLSNASTFKNPFYSPTTTSDASDQDAVLRPCTRAHGVLRVDYHLLNINVWPYYFRWNANTRWIGGTSDFAVSILEKSKGMFTRIAELEAQVTSLEAAKETAEKNARVKEREATIKAKEAAQAVEAAKAAQHAASQAAQAAVAATNALAALGAVEEAEARHRPSVVARRSSAMRPSRPAPVAPFPS